MLFGVAPPQLCLTSRSIIRARQSESGSRHHMWTRRRALLLGRLRPSLTMADKFQVQGGP